MEEAGYYCACSPPDEVACHVVDGKSVCRTTGKCFTSSRSDSPSQLPEYKYGCVSRLQEQLTCRTKTSHLASISCCDPRHFNHTTSSPGGDGYESHISPVHCNFHLEPRLHPHPDKLRTNGIATVSPSPSSFSSEELALIIVLPIIALIVTLILIITVYMRRRKMSHGGRTRFSDITPATESCYVTNSESGSELKSLLDASITSGSGSGLPTMIQRTVNKHVQLHDCIGKGRYGEVWCGLYLGEKVAVKIFTSTDEDSWFRETQVYQTSLLRHENILGFLAADVASRNHTTQLWLITYYHELGSLYDYLNSSSSQPLPHSVLVRLAVSAATGLVHLHTEIRGTRGKPGIAHRDIKSRNVLVKSDLSCCLGDFGLAVMYDEDKGLDRYHTHRVGTKRYMAPELLDEWTGITDNFDSCKQLDVYAFALVLWELARGAGTSGYQPPYYEYVGGVNTDPSFDVMKRVVVAEGQRPTVEAEWKASPNGSVLWTMEELMRESWHRVPSYRLTALRVKRTLQQLEERMVLGEDGVGGGEMV